MSGILRSRGCRGFRPAKDELMLRTLGGMPVFVDPADISLNRAQRRAVKHVQRGVK